jgi:hypothetical protein
MRFVYVPAIELYYIVVEKL